MKRWLNREDLRRFLLEQCLTTGGTVTLSSGKTSGVYFDCKKATLSGPWLAKIAQCMLAEINRLPRLPVAVAGLTLGADPLVAGVAMWAAQLGTQPDWACIVRKKVKGHGSQALIENAPLEGATVVVVDDVITTGGSTAEACARLLEVGLCIVGVVCLVDREEGGAEALHAQFGCPVRSVFKKGDFLGLGG